MYSAISSVYFVICGKKNVYVVTDTGQLLTFDFPPCEAVNAASFSDVALQKII